MGERGGIRFNPVAVRILDWQGSTFKLYFKMRFSIIAIWRHRVYYWIDIGSGVDWHGDVVHIDNLT